MKKKFLIILIILAVVGFIVLMDKLYLKQPAHPSSSAPAVTLKSFTDYGKFYSVKVPSNWQIHQSTATNTIGIKTNHPTKQQIEITQFTLPAEAGVTVQVYKGQPLCPILLPMNTMVSHLPASFDSVKHEWFIPTTNATILVKYDYPGSGGFYGPLRAVSPVPQAVLNADMKTINGILQSFALIHSQPFSCQ